MRLIYIINLFLFSFSSNASSYQTSINRALELKLHQTQTWLKLIRYKKKLLGQGYYSEVSSKDFFLSSRGQARPQEELVETIRQLSRNPKTKCSFPARYMWLKEKLGWQDGDLISECPQFRQWTREGGVESLSLIFATGYLGNPASFFGHPLLKFNFGNADKNGNLMNLSVNYGAFTPVQVNPFAYALKGIFGGYKAGFSHLNFFFSNHNYTETELRDLWEYELKLSRKQVDFLVAHLWELIGRQFPYYFFWDNCAFRMGELLELVVTNPILPKNVPYAIPFSLFDRLSELNLVANRTFMPSRQSRLKHKFLLLNEEERTITESIIDESLEKNRDAFQLLSIEARVKVLEVLFDYYSFRSIQDPDEIKITADKRKVLLERLKLPKSESHSVKFEGIAPEEWQRPVLVQGSIFYDEKYSWGTALRWRPAYYDLLSLEMGDLPNGALSIFDVQGNYADKKVWLDHLHLIDIQSLNLSETGLPGDGGIGWSASLGFENQNLGCRSCLNFHLEMGVGKGFAVHPSTVFVGMLKPRLQTSSRNSGNYAIEPEMAALLSLFREWKTYLSLARRFYLNREKSKRTIFLVENRFGGNRSWDLRAAFHKHNGERIKISYSYYW